MMLSFANDFYRDGNPSRRIRSEDLRSELSNETDAALAAIMQGFDREAACHAARADLLQELIDILEKGVSAPAPDAGISLATEPEAMTGTSA